MTLHGQQSLKSLLSGPLQKRLPAPVLEGGQVVGLGESTGCLYGGERGRWGPDEQVQVVSVARPLKAFEQECWMRR